ncbi:flagella basal body P-ring formation protein FlgA [Fictibacillus nanhaiensis]|uniref:Flp pilus assembly protein CpaB n=1 Tax=Fictibacillus nanhaiensis TaxID=742169 RepID=UPI002041FD03|nr:flagella basal body P-ring formation protein FlgA [Fictibacillus nanhaiensis]MCM3733844.1 flagella basal body P-ring formation protein FlgA [Fictibacillus nanhaiensis]
MVDAKRKALIFLVVAFILAVVTAGVVLNEIRKAQQNLTETTKVAALEGNIKSNEAITSSKIKWVEIPKNAAVSNFIQSEGDLKNQVVLTDMKDGDILTKNVLRSKIDISKGHRVVWLNPTENVLIDENVTEGDRVDIVVSMEEKNVMTTKRALKGIHVVEVDDDVEIEKNKTTSVIKVSLSIEDAEKLIHYQNTAQQIRILRVNELEEKNTEEKKEEAAPAAKPAAPAPATPKQNPAPQAKPKAN